MENDEKVEVEEEKRHGEGGIHSRGIARKVKFGLHQVLRLITEPCSIRRWFLPTLRADRQRSRRGRDPVNADDRWDMPGCE